MNGTVGPALAQHLAGRGADVVQWDRRTMPTESFESVRAVIDRARPNWVCHIATGPVEWAEWIAHACRDLRVQLLWTGSVSVYSERAEPPLTPELAPCATDDYGRYKIECERRVRAECPEALVTRLGWQIGSEASSNTMTSYFARAAAEGPILASTRWIPSCALLEDTADGLRQLMERCESGVFHLEGNRSGLSLFDIASRLERRGNFGWIIRPTEDPRRDNRMQDDRVVLGQIVDRL